MVDGDGMAGNRCLGFAEMLKVDLEVAMGLEYGIGLKAGRVFADPWDIRQLSGCQKCRRERIERMRYMNMHQVIPPGIQCSCREPASSDRK